MEPITWGFIGTIAGAIVGSSASIITTLITGWNSRKLQDNAAAIERQERARDLQRTNLIELQEALFTGMRLTGRAHLEDVESYKTGKNNGRVSLLGEELNQELLLSNRRLSILTERVADNELRAKIKELHRQMTSVLLANSENESTAALAKTSKLFELLMDKLGETLRRTF